MLFLKILFGIVLFLALLLCLDLKLEVAWRDDLLLRAGIGPVLLTLSPKREKSVDPADFTYKKHQKRLAKERAKRKKAAEKKGKKAAPPSEEPKLPTGEEPEETKNKLTFQMVLDLIRYVFRELPVFIGSFRTEILALSVTVGGEDAAKIAQSYGVVSQAAAYLLELLRQNTRLKRIKPGAVEIRADFLAAKTTVRLHVKLRLRLFDIAKVGVHTLVWFLRRKGKSPAKPKEVQKA